MPMLRIANIQQYKTNQVQIRRLQDRDKDVVCAREITNQATFALLLK